MKLTRVTITGADDGVPYLPLLELSQRYPFVEWGILVSSKRIGTARYPQPWWRTTFAYHAEQCKAQYSYHLCGQLARDALAGDLELAPAPRMQLNGFSSFVLPGLALAKRFRDVDWILQCSHLAALRRADDLFRSYPNVCALWDQSGGNGRTLESWPLPRLDIAGAPLSYSGGITEDTVQGLLTKLTGNPEPNVFGIDLETGARTDDTFDLGKVERILKLCAPFVETP